MPPYHPYGSVPQVGAPTFFTFEIADFFNLFGNWAAWIPLAALDIPLAPQLTADFCSQPPPSDLADVGDVAGLASGIIGIGAGSFRRVGNSIKAEKWQALCEFTIPTHEGTSEVDVPADWYLLERHLAYPNPTVEDWHSVRMVLGPMPENLELWAFANTPEPEPGFEALRFNTTQRAFWLSTSPELGMDVFSQEFVDLDPVSAGTSAGAETWHYGGGGTDSRRYLALAGHHGSEGETTFYFDLIYKPRAIEQAEPVDPILPPGSLPTVGGPCTDPTLGDLCRTLATLNDKINYLVRNVAPPQVVPDDQPTPLVPIDPTPPPAGQPTPLEPVARPAQAVGVVIELTTVPAWQARHGTDPLFFPALGHVAMVTAFGPLPSVLIKHNPLVVLPVPPQVVEIKLDLAPGVIGQVRWLSQPK